ncbi:CNNM domain-containing protein [Piscirickettsia litoralis]|uniref:Hemolysin n=1 Tax=Piscirickettsia litoralis TaxID=1891921 RepID=A0ABX3A3H3_9GAMM|nr:CNNM domain-containing protein [Piscirickettsia litoralis]ODN42787.1 hemolysin [Piscirickettsia litoralis]
MVLLIIFLLLSLLISFICSVLEAVLLSVTLPHITLLKKQEKKSGYMLDQLKADLNKPLTAILTLNTVGHTVGAVGVGAQVTKMYGDHYLALSSAVLTVLILFLSEIIPKTIGANYWDKLSGVTAYMLKYLTWLMMPVIFISEKMMAGLTQKNELTGFGKDELLAMTELNKEKGFISSDENLVFKNLLLLEDQPVRKIMTPRTVVFSLSSEMTVETFFHKYDQAPFSRILIHAEDQDSMVGFVMREDLLLAAARNNYQNQLSYYSRELVATLDKFSIAKVFNDMLNQRLQIMLVVDEYGSVQGIVTLEDIIEELLGREIVDEHDQVESMQKLAFKKKNKRLK